MQLSPISMDDPSTFGQLVNKGFAKLMWLIILSRVLGYCIKNYYMINRQAVRRATRYVGKQSAFSAELVTTDILKKTKDQKSSSNVKDNHKGRDGGNGSGSDYHGNNNHRRNK